jgi:hypothetical protein
MPSVIDQLEREWTRLAADRRVARRLQAACAAAGGASDLNELERYVRESPAADADQVLVALVGPASAGGQLEARVLVHLLLPGVRRLARRWWALGDRDERAAAAVAAVWHRICSYRLDRRPGKVAANILMDAEKELRRAVAAQGGPAAELPLDHPAPSPQQPAALELVDLLGSAVGDGVLTASDAQLIAASRIAGVPLTDVAAVLRTPARTLQRRRRDAERALVTSVVAA